MTIRPYFAALLIAITPASAADEDDKAPAPSADDSKEGSLPKEVRGFQGSVTGIVQAVDLTAVTLKIKVTKAEPDATKNKATKPEALAGMSITVTPLGKDVDGKSVLDEKASDYIKGTKSGDPMTIAVRTSSKGVVFRLLKVPSAGTK